MPEEDECFIASALQQEPTSLMRAASLRCGGRSVGVDCGRRPRLGLQLTALVALAGLLFVTLLVASPALHKAFHGRDASLPTHQCVATLLAKGSLVATVPAVTVPVLLLLVF